MGWFMLIVLPGGLGVHPPVELERGQVGYQRWLWTCHYLTGHTWITLMSGHSAICPTTSHPNRFYSEGTDSRFASSRRVHRVYSKDPGRDQGEGGNSFMCELFYISFLPLRGLWRIHYVRVTARHSCAIDFTHCEHLSSSSAGFIQSPLGTKILHIDSSRWMFDGFRCCISLSTRCWQQINSTLTAARTWCVELGNTGVFSSAGINSSLMWAQQLGGRLKNESVHIICTADV